MRMLQALIGLALPGFLTAAAPTQVLWEFNSLEKIGGFPVTLSGNPKVVTTEYGPAVSFDGDGDRLLVEGNPFGANEAYTMEVIFKPKSVVPANNEPRFLHIEVPGQPKRVIMELRFNAKGEWAFDAGMTTDGGYQVLFDDKLTHPGDQWAQVASWYDGTTMKSFVNGKLEGSAAVPHKGRLIEAAAVSSVGARMNKVYWMNGLIKTIRVTHAAIDPKDFLTPGTPNALLRPAKPAKPAARGSRKRNLLGRIMPFGEFRWIVLRTSP